MDSTPADLAREEKSNLFAKGGAGGPGRPRGRRSALAAALDMIPEQDVTAIRDKLVERAKNGDTQSARLILDRFWPVPKGRPLDIDLPVVESAQDLPKLLAALLMATARGDISPDEAASLAGVVDQQRRAIELSDIEKRLAAIEQQQSRK